MQSQEALMKFCPGWGSERPYPSHAMQWRAHNGQTAWLFNPWNGKRRDPRDVGTDPFGVLVLPSEDSLVGPSGGPYVKEK